MTLTLASGHCRDMKIHNTLLPNRAAVANSSAPAYCHVKHVVKLLPLITKDLRPNENKCLLHSSHVNCTVTAQNLLNQEL